MLTARGDDVDRIHGLEIGADDYLMKPFNPRELAARIQAVLRRSALPATEAVPPVPKPLFSAILSWTRGHAPCGVRTESWT